MVPGRYPTLIGRNAIQRRYSGVKSLRVLTAAAHGAVSLELSHYFWSREGAEERYATLTRAAAEAFRLDA